MNQLEAFLFDVDGTLADTERDGHRVAFNQAFQDAGLDWDWTEVLYGQLLSVTGGKERIKHYLAQFNREFKAPTDLDAFVADLHARKTEHFTAMLAEGRIPLRPGVRRLLEEARDAGVRLGIATTTTPANVEALLTHTIGPEALGWFEVIAAGDIVPAKKPAPDIYVYVLKALGLDARQCVAFEDSAHGLQASLGAGLLTIVAVNEYTRDQAFPRAALVLDQFGEPDQPFTVLAGDAGRSRYLDLATVQDVYTRASAAQRIA